MAINVSGVQYSGGFLPDLILLTQCYYHRGTRLNAMKGFCLCSLWCHLSVLRCSPPDWGMLRRSRCVQIFLKTNIPNCIARVGAVFPIMPRHNNTRDGTAEPVSRDQILRRKRGQGIINFPCSAEHEQSRIGNLTRLIHTLAIALCVTYMHT